MLSSKRKRHELEDSDDDEPSFGRQILPVANLPEDFNNEPSDGMEYLFTVRRDARYLPHVTRVANPFETENADPPQEDNRVIPSHITLPSEEWRAVLEIRFRNFRMNVNQPTIHIQMPPGKGPRSRLMPEKKERDLWWAYLAGNPESDWNPPKKPKQTQKMSKRRRGMRAFSDDAGSHDGPQHEIWRVDDEGGVENVSRVDPTESLPTPICSPAPPESSTSREEHLVGPSSESLPPRTTSLKPREPMPSLLQHIDQKMALHLLMYFAHWFNLYLQQPDPAIRPLESHARWIFALLTKIEDHILLKESIKTRTVKSEDLDNSGDQEVMSERACWIIVCIVVGVWGQRDLWMDAEEMLKTD